MYSLFFIVFLVCGLCGSDEVDLGYGLRIGHAIDVFANYGDLCQVTQVVSADYDDEEEDEEAMEPFREKNIRVFGNAGSEEDVAGARADAVIDTSIELCETFDNLLNSYFKAFKIEGADKPWKAFMGDWILDEIMRTFGLEYDPIQEDCCYVLVRMVKAQKSVKLGDLKDTQVVSYVQKAIDGLNVSDPNEIRKFMKSYGTHYIDSYVTGNSIYQVFKYKRSGFNLLKSYVRKRNSQQFTSENLRFYFSSYFLKQIGDIRIASGNKTIEKWAQKNLRDNQYLYSRPSLLRLYRNLKLVYQLNDLLDDGALLGMTLKTLRPLFKDKTKGEKYAEVLENDIKLWEINA